MSDPVIPYPHLEFELPTRHYHEGEKIAVVMLPSSGVTFQVQLAPCPSGYEFDPCPPGNRFVLPTGLPPGDYFLKARWRSHGQEQTGWTPWSAPLRFTVHFRDKDLSALWEFDHRLSLMLERGVGGAITLTDPEALPPNASDLTDPAWFRTPVYEGCTSLVNEEKEYYQDPLEYYFHCIKALQDNGTRFITWHDLLDGTYGKFDLEILLQFDVDGGPRSMRRICEKLVSLGIRASIMIHRRGHHWYPYVLEDMGIDWLREAEQAGWAIGYHNNSLSQVMGDQSAEIGQEDLDKARAIFGRDVKDLRRYFNIRTFTHHGGNIYNLKVTPPSGLDIIGVDRNSAPELWKPIRSMFSDGGFVSRPCTLQQKVNTLISNSHSHLHFFRNHPFKYANYTQPVDVPPRSLDDLPKAGLAADPETLDWQRNELDKESRWLRQRQTSRAPVRLSYLRLKKPISSKFKSFTRVEPIVSELRKRRKSTFLRLYPWAEGDPRVFWWRMLEAWAPKLGELLNVGALPPDQKDENNAFLSPDVMVRDVDIDSSREPDFCFDIVQAPDFLANRFSGTMLFGLPYFASPSKAVASCARLTQPGGVGLFGFVADTHPARGSLWHPVTRHLWRMDKEPLSNIGLRGNLWSFDQAGLEELFNSWDSFQAEFMGHYWFVAATKSHVPTPTQTYTHTQTHTSSPPAFIWPMGRSGGTLLTTILGVHSQLAMSYEIYEDGLCYEPGDYLSPKDAIQLLSEAGRKAGIRVKATSKHCLDIDQNLIKQWIRHISQPPFRSFVARAHRGDLTPFVLLEELKSFANQQKDFSTIDNRLDFIDQLMRRKMKQDGKTRWGGKAKASLDDLSRRHPNAAILMVIRDGRDILASRMKTGQFDTKPEHVAKEWVEKLETFERYKSIHPGPMHQVKYESLVTDPKTVLQEVCNVIGVPFEEAMLSYEKENLSLLQNPYGHLSAGRISEGLNANTVGRWKKEMSESDVIEFERVAENKLSELGYNY